MTARIFAVGPRYLLDSNSAVATSDPSHPVTQEYRDIPKRNEPKESHAESIIPGPWFVALRTPGFAVGPRPHMDHQSRVIVVSDDRPLAVSVNEAFDRVEFIE